MGRDHPFSQRNKTTERTVGVGIKGDREVCVCVCVCMCVCTHNTQDYQPVFSKATTFNALSRDTAKIRTPYVVESYFIFAVLLKTTQPRVHFLTSFPNISRSVIKKNNNLWH